jgi:hypothetical protein
MAISNTSLTTSIANVYVSSGNTVVSTMYFCNTDTGARNFDLYLIPSGIDSANATVQIYKNVQVASSDTYVMDMEKLVLGNGDMLRANASANTAITCTVSFVGI